MTRFGGNFPHVGEDLAMLKPAKIVYIATSIDGFIATVDAIVMGRATFEQVLTFGLWPYEGTPLTVLSTTLESVPEHLQGFCVLFAQRTAPVEQCTVEVCYNHRMFHVRCSIDCIIRPAPRWPSSLLASLQQPDDKRSQP